MQPPTHHHVYSLRHRVGLAVLACLQNALVGGLIYGWPNIDRTLLGAPKEHGGAGLTLVETTRMFSWASATSLASTLVLGAVLDHCGPRICSVSGQLCILLGIFLFAVADSFAAYAVASCSIAFGASGIQLSIVHVANLFPLNQYFVLCGLNGSISLSVCVFAAFDWLFQNYQGTTVKLLFGSYLPVVFASVVASVMLWPDQPYEAPEPNLHHHHHRRRSSADIHIAGNGDSGDVNNTCEDGEDDPFAWEEPTPEDVFVEATVAHQHLLEQPLTSYLRSKRNPRFERSKSYILSDRALHVSDSEGDADLKKALISLKDQPFINQITSATYIRSLLFFIITCFLANFYVASFSTEVADFQAFTFEDQHRLAQMLALAMSSGVFVAFFVGFLMDRIGQVVCLVLTIVLGQLQLVILVLLGNQKPWIITSFGLYVLFRQFLFPAYIASITDRLGFKYFGLLSGIGFALSGASQVLMASLVVAVQGDCHRMVSFDPADPASDCSSGYWMQLHWCEIALLGVLLLAPLFEHLDRSNRDRQVKKVLERRTSFQNYGSLATHTENDDGSEGSELVFPT